MPPKHIALDCIVLFGVSHDPQYPTKNNGFRWGTLDIRSRKLQGNVLCFVKVLGEINKSRFSVYNFTRLVTYIFCKRNNRCFTVLYWPRSMCYSPQ